MVCWPWATAQIVLQRNRLGLILFDLDGEFTGLFAEPGGAGEIIDALPALGDFGALVGLIGFIEDLGALILERLQIVGLLGELALKLGNGLGDGGEPGNRAVIELDPVAALRFGDLLGDGIVSGLGVVFIVIGGGGAGGFDLLGELGDFVDQVVEFAVIQIDLPHGLGGGVQFELSEGALGVRAGERRDHTIGGGRFQRFAGRLNLLIRRAKDISLAERRLGCGNVGLNLAIFLIGGGCPQPPR